MKLLQLYNEIKVKDPITFSDADKDTIYINFQGTRKPYDLSEVDFEIDIHKMSAQYLLDLDYDGDFIQELPKNHPLFSPPHIRKALKQLPIQKLEDSNLGDVYVGNDQYSLLVYKNIYYFVDSQGASYPRYVTKLLNFK